MKKIPHIIIVGGGAGGLELATSLGRSLGKKHHADITLVDKTLTHMWKPLLHEVAAGTLNNFSDELTYISHANNNYFQFQLGELVGLDRKNKSIKIKNPLSINDQEISLHYDILVLSIGGISNNFNTPGTDQYCYYLDSIDQAKRVHQYLLKEIINTEYDDNSQSFNIIIVGGGATGVELAAELHFALGQISKLTRKNRQGNAIANITLIEAAKRVLSHLPERISEITLEQLKKLNINVLTDHRVTEVSNHSLTTQTGEVMSADVIIWAAGVKGQPIAAKLDGLEINRSQQIIVKQTLQTTTDKNIFAFGDCAQCPNGDNKSFVPARAQAAHQQAELLSKSIKNKLANKPLSLFKYHDRGSLISLSHHSTVGKLMGKLHKSLLVEGWIARMFYLSLYKMHQAKLFGWTKVILVTIVNFMTRRLRSRLKLH